ncbi:MAG: DUF692 domain-containing protein [Pseudomonadota bacterium]
MIGTRIDMRIAAKIPPRAGLGFKLEHANDVLSNPPELGWFEVHPENYMVKGGPRLAILEQLRENYPLSLHGVGQSLGGADPLHAEHLDAFRRLVERLEPGLVSEHIAWSAHDGAYYADLLPTPFTKTALQSLVAHVDQMQSVLKRSILVENPTHYLPLHEAEMDEITFLRELTERAGCGLLIDVNNIHVSAHNLGNDPHAYIDALPVDLIGEIHIAGNIGDPGGELLIDSHSAPVADNVWTLLDRLLARSGPRPVLVEWDNDVPVWPVLYREAQRAESHLRVTGQLRQVA